MASKSAQSSELPVQVDYKSGSVQSILQGFFKGFTSQQSQTTSSVPKNTYQSDLVNENEIQQNPSNNMLFKKSDLQTSAQQIRQVRQNVGGDLMSDQINLSTSQSFSILVCEPKQSKKELNTKNAARPDVSISCGADGLLEEDSECSMQCETIDERIYVNENNNDVSKSLSKRTTTGAGIEAASGRLSIPQGAAMHTSPDDLQLGTQTDLSGVSQPISEFRLCQEVDFPLPSMMQTQTVQKRLNSPQRNVHLGEQFQLIESISSDVNSSQQQIQSFDEKQFGNQSHQTPPNIVTKSQKVENFDKEPICLNTSSSDELQQIKCKYSVPKKLSFTGAIEDVFVDFAVLEKEKETNTSIRIQNQNQNQNISDNDTAIPQKEANDLSPTQKMPLNSNNKNQGLLTSGQDRFIKAAQPEIGSTSGPKQFADLNSSEMINKQNTSDQEASSSSAEIHSEISAGNFEHLNIATKEQKRTKNVQIQKFDSYQNDSRYSLEDGEDTTYGNSKAFHESLNMVRDSSVHISKGLPSTLIFKNKMRQNQKVNRTFPQFDPHVNYNKKTDKGSYCDQNINTYDQLHQNKPVDRNLRQNSHLVSQNKSQANQTLLTSADRTLWQANYEAAGSICQLANFSAQNLDLFKSLTPGCILKSSQDCQSTSIGPNQQSNLPNNNNLFHNQSISAEKLYIVQKPLVTQSDFLLYQVVEDLTREVFTLRAYSLEEEDLFANEVEKLELLKELVQADTQMNQRGAMSVASLIDAFSTEIISNISGEPILVYALILEPVSLSLSSLLSMQNLSQKDRNSISGSSSRVQSPELSQLMTQQPSVAQNLREIVLSKRLAGSFAHLVDHETGGFSLDLIKMIGFKLAVLLKFFSMHGLRLLHGKLSAKNVFFKHNFLMEAPFNANDDNLSTEDALRIASDVRIVDFSNSCFIDDLLSNQNLGAQHRDRKDQSGKGNRADEFQVAHAPEMSHFLKSCMAERQAIQIQKADLWSLGCLLFQLHFRDSIDPEDPQKSLHKAFVQNRQHNSQDDQSRQLDKKSHSCYLLFNSLLSQLITKDVEERLCCDQTLWHPFFDPLMHTNRNQIFPLQHQKQPLLSIHQDALESLSSLNQHLHLQQQVQQQQVSMTLSVSRNTTQMMLGGRSRSGNSSKGTNFQFGNTTQVNQNNNGTMATSHMQQSPIPSSQKKARKLAGSETQRSSSGKQPRQGDGSSGKNKGKKGQHGSRHQNNFGATLEEIRLFSQNTAKRLSKIDTCRTQNSQNSNTNSNISPAKNQNANKHTTVDLLKNSDQNESSCFEIPLEHVAEKDQILYQKAKTRDDNDHKLEKDKNCRQNYPKKPCLDIPEQATENTLLTDFLSPSQSNMMRSPPLVVPLQNISNIPTKRQKDLIEILHTDSSICQADLEERSQNQESISAVKKLRNFLSPPQLMHSCSQNQNKSEKNQRQKSVKRQLDYDMNLYERPAGQDLGRGSVILPHEEWSMKEQNRIGLNPDEQISSLKSLVLASSIKAREDQDLMSQIKVQDFFKDLDIDLGFQNLSAAQKEQSKKSALQSSSSRKHHPTATSATSGGNSTLRMKKSNSRSAIYPQKTLQQSTQNNKSSYLSLPQNPKSIAVKKRSLLRQTQNSHQNKSSFNLMKTAQGIQQQESATTAATMTTTSLTKKVSALSNLLHQSSGSFMTKSQHSLLSNNQNLYTTNANFSGNNSTIKKSFSRPCFTANIGNQSLPVQKMPKAFLSKKDKPVADKSPLAKTKMIGERLSRKQTISSAANQLTSQSSCSNATSGVQSRRNSSSRNLSQSLRGAGNSSIKESQTANKENVSGFIKGGTLKEMSHQKTRTNSRLGRQNSKTNINVTRRTVTSKL